MDRRQDADIVTTHIHCAALERRLGGELRAEGVDCLAAVWGKKGGGGVDGVLLSILLLLLSPHCCHRQHTHHQLH